MDRKEQIAKEISQKLPTFLRHMFPYVFEAMEVPPSQVLALVSIEERGQCRLGELKNEMHVSAPTITGIIDRLERDGYVKRIQDENDRRVTNVVLTRKGIKLVRRFRENIRKRWAYILSKMPLEMGETAKNLVGRIVKGFQDGTI